MLGGGAGRQLAHWVCEGKPEIDMFNCDIRWTFFFFDIENCKFLALPFSSCYTLHNCAT